MNSRQEMVEVLREKYRLDAPRVLSAMLQVPREEFVPEEARDLAYEDSAVSIGHGQTISQPYTVAFMTSLLDLKGGEKVLEIGTGSGYQAAILSLLADKVYTVERVPKLASSAKERLKKLGFKNVEVRTGGGEIGWRQKAPFDAIIVTAGIADGISEQLLSQLKDGGILVAPVGKTDDKIMTRFLKKKGRISKKKYGTFRFVPFIES